MMIHFEMSFPNEYPFKPFQAHEVGKCAAHMMRPTAGVARWRERPSAFFCWELWDHGLWQVAEWRNSSGYAFGLPLGLWSFEFRAVFWPVGFPGFWPCGFPPRNKAGLPNFGSCWQRFKQRAICGGCLGPQNLAEREKMTQVDHIQSKGKVVSHFMFL